MLKDIPQRPLSIPARSVCGGLKSDYPVSVVENREDSAFGANGEDNPASHPPSLGGRRGTHDHRGRQLRACGATALVASVGGRLEGELTRAGAELIRIDRLATKNPIAINGNASIIAKIIARRKVDLVHRPLAHHPRGAPL